MPAHPRAARVAHSTLLAALALVFVLAGCAQPDRADATQPITSSPTSFASIEIPAGQGPAAFQAAREILRDEGFTLDRVDAPLGVLTTLPRATEGVGRPWAPKTDSPLQDLIQNQRRSVRVVLRPAGSPAPAFAADDPNFNLLDDQRPLAMHITATVERITRPTRRLSPDGVRLLPPAIDPTLDRQGIAGGYSVDLRTDPTTQARLAQLISAALTQGQP
jgi:hypothetical protein